MVELALLGWDAARDAEWAAAHAALSRQSPEGAHADLPRHSPEGATAGDVPGRVSLEHNHIYRVFTTEGEILAEASGRLKHLAGGRHELPAVGDWVALRMAPPGQRSQILRLLSRRSTFTRKSAGRETEEQVVAANIDVVFVVFGLDAPLKLRAIERYLLVTRRSGARPVVVLNKRDLHPDVAEAVAEVTAAAGDVPVHATSVREGDSLEALAAYFSPGGTIALLGPSGAGKSSIVNRLVGRELLATGDVRGWDARGRHTSVHRQLLVRPEGGLVIDTPGLRELQLWDTEDGIGDAFDDIAQLGGDCRFRDCRHEQEPGCAVKAAVEAGSLDPGRYENYVKLAREQAALEQKRDERALLDAKRQGKIGSKALKALQKQRGR